MTRRSRSASGIERRLDALESDREHAGEIFVVSIGGDPDKPRGWLSPEEYERHYADPPEDVLQFNSGINWHDP